MGARVKPKAWGDRLPLDDIRGLRLLGAAIYHACRIAHEPVASAASDPISIQCAMIDCDDRGLALARINSQVKSAEAEVHSWRGLLSRLDATDKEISDGEFATLQDFIFDPADLWRHKHLALLVVEGRVDYWPEFERETPICRNPDLWPRSDLGDLFDQYLSWHTAPPYAKPMFNLEFGRQIEHFHWRNYLAPYCEEPQGKGHPEGPRWHDGRNAAASYAWSLLHDAARDGKEMSVSAAVRKSVASFKMLRPTDPEPHRREADGYIRASSKDQAEKGVRKILDRIIDREPPWGPFEN